MGYALLWLESLAASVLFVATVAAIAGRLSSRSQRAMVVIPGVLIPLMPLGALAWVAGYLKLAAGLVHVPFAAPLALAVLYLVGAIAVLVAGLRRREGVAVASSWPRGRLATAFIVAMTLGLMTYWNLDLAVRNGLVLARAEAGAMALSVAPPRPRDRENAALLYVQASDAMSGDLSPFWGDHGLAVPANDPKLRAFLDTQQRALQLLHQAAAKPDCEFDRNWGSPSFAMLLPELQGLRGGARRLAIDARMQIADGRLDAAVRDVNALFALADHASREPILISMLVGIAIERIAAESLEALLDADGAADHLSDVKIDPMVSFRRTMTRSLVMEEAMGLSVFAMMEGDPNGVEVMMREFSTPPGRIQADSAGAGVLVSIYRVFLLDSELPVYRSVMEQVQTMSRKPMYQTLDEMDELRNPFKVRGYGIMTSLLLPAVVNVRNTSEEGEAIHELAQLAVAVARYRAQHGQNPPALEALAPKFIDAVPIDPFDGKPMKMKTVDSAVVLYSIGKDRVDDGGTRRSDDKQKGDVVVRVGK